MQPYIWTCANAKNCRLRRLGRIEYRKSSVTRLSSVQIYLCYAQVLSACLPPSQPQERNLALPRATQPSKGKPNLQSLNLNHTQCGTALVLPFMRSMEQVGMKRGVTMGSTVSSSLPAALLSTHHYKNALQSLSASTHYCR